MAFGSSQRRSIEIGGRDQFSKTITESDVATFAGLVGDFSPQHVDAEYARRSRLGQRTAHGILAGGLIGAVINSRLPGPGCTWSTRGVRPGRTEAPSALVGKGRDGAEASSQQINVTDTRKLQQLFRHHPVWLLVMARLLSTMGNQLTHVHIVAFFISVSYNPLLAASAIGAVGLIGMAGRPISGALSDVLGREVVYTVGSGMQIGGLVILLTLGDGQRLWPIILFVALNGLSDGIFGLMVGAKAADLFPTNTLGSVMGLVQMGRGLGIMLGPLIGGLLFDLQGNYVVAFSLALVLVCVAIGCMWGASLTGGQQRAISEGRFMC